MPNWKFLNQHRIRSGYLASTDSDGFNGAFSFCVCNHRVNVIASDQEGWKHVSVTLLGSRKPPRWEIMCAVKDLFWEEHETAIQFHPPKSVYVNNHPGCLHLWSSTDGREFPLPNPLMVGLPGHARPRSRHEAETMHREAMELFNRAGPHGGMPTDYPATRPVDSPAAAAPPQTFAVRSPL